MTKVQLTIVALMCALGLTLAVVGRAQTTGGSLVPPQFGSGGATTPTDKAGTKRLTAEQTKAVLEQGRATAQRQDELNRALDEALAAKPGTEQGTAALAGLQTAWARRQEAGRAADSLFNRLCAKHEADPDRYRYSDDAAALEPLPEVKPPAKGK